MQIYLVRHTETIFGKENCYGITDAPLREPYLANFQKIAVQLGTQQFQIISSPLQRCLILAEYLQSKNLIPTPILTDLRLREMNFGNWEMKKWKAINPSELNPWMENFVFAKTPEGESFEQLSARVLGFWKEKIEADLPSATNLAIVIITHAGVIRSLLCHFLQKPLQEAFDIALDFGSITEIVLESSASVSKVIRLNQIP